MRAAKGQTNSLSLWAALSTAPVLRESLNNAELESLGSGARNAYPRLMDLDSAIHKILPEHEEQ